VKKQLYVVKIQSEQVVLAESEAEAERLTRAHKWDFDNWDTEAQPMHAYPDGWDGLCLAWGDDEQRGLAALIAYGCAPEMKGEP
jgi:hypothetical protein